MFRVQHAPGLSPEHRRRLVRLAETVCRRTGIRCSYNAKFNRLLFHWTVEPDSGPLGLPAFSGDTGAEARYSDIDIDDAVRWIQYGKIDRSKKEQIAAANKQREDWDKNDAVNKRLEDRRPSALDRARFLDQKRRGVQKIIAT
jgi:hypothetical protein